MSPLRLDPTNAESVAAIRRYTRDLERAGLRPRSIVCMDGRLRSFAASLGERSMFEAKVEDVEDYCDSRRGRGGRYIDSRTRYHILSTLHGFYVWAINEEMTVQDPTVRIRRPRMRRVLPRPIRDEDLALALQEAPPELRAMILLGAYQGLRCQEIAGLERSDVFETSEPPLLRVLAGKGGYERVVPLHPEVMEALRCVPLPRSGPIFRRQHGSPHTAVTVSQTLRKYFAELNIDATAHQLRHWFGTRAYAASRDIRMTQELMGHASPNTTAGYVAVAVVDAREAVESITVRKETTK